MLNHDHLYMYRVSNCVVVALHKKKHVFSCVLNEFIPSSFASFIAMYYKPVFFSPLLFFSSFLKAKNPISIALHALLHISIYIYKHTADSFYYFFNRNTLSRYKIRICYERFRTRRFTCPTFQYSTGSSELFRHYLKISDT
jgi:hypothetical protein